MVDFWGGKRRALICLLISLVLVSFSGMNAEAEIGDLLESFTPSLSGSGRAVAFDPATGRLFYTVAGNTAIFITDANNSPSTSIDPGVVCGALAWDAKRSQLWCGTYDGSGNVYTINPDDGTRTFVFTFTTTDSCYSPDDDKRYDGLAYDEGPTPNDDDDSLWVSGDAARTLYHLALSGDIIDSFTVPNNPRSDRPGCNTGIAVDGVFLWLALQSGPDQQPHDIVLVTKSDPTTVIFHFPFSSTDTPVPEGIALDVVTVPGKHALWSNQSSNPPQLKLWDITPVQEGIPTIVQADNPLYAGYAAFGTITSPINFTKVEASWTVQPIECPFPQVSKVAYWVGLGGISAPGLEETGLEQIGVASFCILGVTVHTGVWQIFTEAGTQGIQYLYDPIAFPIEANDEMEASVISYGNGGYQLTLHNITGDWTFSEVVIGSAAETAVHTAECIVEYPPPHDSITLPNSSITIPLPSPIPFSNFGEFTFRECKADDNSLLLYPSLIKLTLKRDDTTLAEPSEINPPSDFTVIWRHE